MTLIQYKGVKMAYRYGQYPETTTHRCEMFTGNFIRLLWQPVSIKICCHQNAKMKTDIDAEHIKHSELTYWLTIYL